MNTKIFSVLIFSLCFSDVASSESPTGRITSPSFSPRAGRKKSPVTSPSFTPSSTPSPSTSLAPVTEENEGEKTENIAIPSIFTQRPSEHAHRIATIRRKYNGAENTQPSITEENEETE